MWPRISVYPPKYIVRHTPPPPPLKKKHVLLAMYAVYNCYATGKQTYIELGLKFRLGLINVWTVLVWRMRCQRMLVLVITSVYQYILDLVGTTGLCTRSYSVCFFFFSFFYFVPALCLSL